MTPKKRPCKKQPSYDPVTKIWATEGWPPWPNNNARLATRFLHSSSARRTVWSRWSWGRSWARWGLSGPAWWNRQSRPPGWRPGRPRTGAPPWIRSVSSASPLWCHPGWTPARRTSTGCPSLWNIDGGKERSGKKDREQKIRTRSVQGVNTVLKSHSN